MLLRALIPSTGTLAPTRSVPGTDRSHCIVRFQGCVDRSPPEITDFHVGRLDGIVLRILGIAQRSLHFVHCYLNARRVV